MLTTTATELPRLMRCIGSRLMPAALPPDFDTEARDEGNCADWLAEQLFDGNTVPAGTKAPNGYVVTDDMIEHVRVYLAALDCGSMQIVTTFGGDEWTVKGRADHIRYRAAVEQTCGVDPTTLTEPPLSTLTIDDLKYGWRIVSPVENWTLLAHAIGWCINNATQPDRIILRIIQPRPFHADGPVREWEVPGGYAGLVERYNAIAVRLTSADDTLFSGPDQCAKCHALATCPAARAACMNAIDATALAFSDDLANDVLAFEHETLSRAEQMIKARRDSIDELMTHRIRSGQVIQGYALRTRQGQRAWAIGMSGTALSAAAGVDLRKDGIVTPAEAERRGVSKQVIAALTHRATIGQKLERIDADAVARSAFGER